MAAESIQITCADGIVLSATLYPVETPVSAVMIGPATGIRRQFYHSFASHLAENGHAVITFDNRGIGDSGSDRLNDVHASLINWGRLDMTAVLEELKVRYPAIPCHLIGHSAGGQLVGLMDNALELRSMFNIASSSGRMKSMSYPFRLSALFYMKVFIPISNALFGKTNSQWVGMGEPLPKIVANQWAYWCSNSGYVATDFGKAVREHHYDELTFPTKWLYATDDDIANLANVRDMVRVFPKIEADIYKLDPKELGMKDIGHMKFFSSKRSKLWTLATDWLHQQNSSD